MKIIGITGYIGSGKSTVSKIFKNYGFYYFDSDAYVSYLNKNKQIILSIKKYFPDSVVNNELDKKILKEILFKNYEENIAILEKIYHPFVVRKVKRLIFFSKILFRKFLLLEVPLLFETKINELCDITILVKCSVSTQIKRVTERSKINIEDLKKIMEKQNRLNYKNISFNYIIDTDIPMKELEEKVNKIIKEITND